MKSFWLSRRSTQQRLTGLVETLKINNLKPLPEYLFGKLAVDDLGTALVPEHQFLLEPGETSFAPLIELYKIATLNLTQAKKL